VLYDVYIELICKELNKITEHKNKYIETNSRVPTLLIITIADLSSMPWSGAVNWKFSEFFFKLAK
jgi:hypothetical protein